MSLALLLGSVNAGCVNFRPPPKPVAANLAGDAPSVVWTSRAGRRFTGRLEVRDQILYGGSVDRKVYAVDLRDGEVRWSARLSGIVAGGVLVNDDAVYAASSRPEGRVYALRRRNGKQIWRTGTGPVGAPLALVDSTLLALTQRGDLIALSAPTGKIKWRQRVGFSRVAAVPAGAGALLVSTIDSLLRVDLTNGKVLQKSASPGTVVSAWVPYAGGLVAGTTDSLIVSIDPSDLHQNWSLRVDAPVLGSPAILGDTLFVTSRMGTIYRIDPGMNPRAHRVASLDWPVTTPTAVVNRKIVLGGADGTIRALRTNGSEIWRVRVWRPVEMGPLPMPDGLIAIGGNGDLHRYRQ